MVATKPPRLLPPADAGKRGIQPATPLGAVPPRTTPTNGACGSNDEPIRSHAHAAQTLDDAPYLAYCLVQAFKLFCALVTKRWPHLQ